MLLKTGIRFQAEVKGFPTYHYRFIGFDLDDAKYGTGCKYIILFNEEFQNETCVDKNWFCSRQIIIEDADGRRQNRPKSRCEKREGMIYL